MNKCSIEYMVNPESKYLVDIEDFPGLDGVKKLLPKKLSKGGAYLAWIRERIGDKHRLIDSNADLLKYSAWVDLEQFVSGLIFDGVLYLNKNTADESDLFHEYWHFSNLYLSSEKKRTDIWLHVYDNMSKYGLSFDFSRDDLLYSIDILHGKVNNVKNAPEYYLEIEEFLANRYSEFQKSSGIYTKPKTVLGRFFHRLYHKIVNLYDVMFRGKVDLNRIFQQMHMGYMHKNIFGKFKLRSKYNYSKNLKILKDRRFYNLGILSRLGFNPKEISDIVNIFVEDGYKILGYPSQAKMLNTIKTKIISKDKDHAESLRDEDIEEIEVSFNEIFDVFLKELYEVLDKAYTLRLNAQRKYFSDRGLVQELIDRIEKNDSKLNANIALRSLIKGYIDKIENENTEELNNFFKHIESEFISRNSLIQYDKESGEYLEIDEDKFTYSFKSGEKPTYTNFNMIRDLVFAKLKIPINYSPGVPDSGLVFDTDFIGLFKYQDEKFAYNSLIFWVFSFDTREDLEKALLELRANPVDANNYLLRVLGRSLRRSDKLLNDIFRMYELEAIPSGQIHIDRKLDIWYREENSVDTYTRFAMQMMLSILSYQGGLAELKTIIEEYKLLLKITSNFRNPELNVDVDIKYYIDLIMRFGPIVNLHYNKDILTNLDKNELNRIIERIVSIAEYMIRASSLNNMKIENEEDEQDKIEKIKALEAEVHHFFNRSIINNSGYIRYLIQNNFEELSYKNAKGKKLYLLRPASFLHKLNKIIRSNKLKFFEELVHRFPGFHEDMLLIASFLAEHTYPQEKVKNSLHERSILYHIVNQGHVVEFEDLDVSSLLWAFNVLHGNNLKITPVGGDLKPRLINRLGGIWSTLPMLILFDYHRMLNRNSMEYYANIDIEKKSSIFPDLDIKIIEEFYSEFRNLKTSDEISNAFEIFVNTYIMPILEEQFKYYAYAIINSEGNNIKSGREDDDVFIQWVEWAFSYESPEIADPPKILGVKDIEYSYIFDLFMGYTAQFATNTYVSFLYGGDVVVFGDKIGDMPMKVGKRFVSLYTTGRYLAIKRHIRKIYVKDLMLGDQMLTDGMSIISLKHYNEIMEHDGNGSIPNIKENIEALKKMAHNYLNFLSKNLDREITDEELLEGVRVFFNHKFKPIKPHNVYVNNDHVQIQEKNSYLILSPAVLIEYKHMLDLFVFAIMNDLDAIHFESASKAAKYRSFSIEDFREFLLNPRSLDQTMIVTDTSEFLKIQTDSSDRYLNTLGGLGTQLFKVLSLYARLTDLYGEYDSALANFFEAHIAMIERLYGYDKEKFLNTLFLNGVIPSPNLEMNILWDPAYLMRMNNEIVKLLNKFYKINVPRQETINIILDPNLKTVNEDGVFYFEAKVPYPFKELYTMAIIYGYADALGGLTVTDELLEDAKKNNPDFYEILIKEIDRIAYRVPLEGAYSAYPIRVVRFLSPLMSKSIILPVEYNVTGGGLAFDKTYVVGLWSSYYSNNFPKGFQVDELMEAWNHFFEVILKIMKSETYIKDLFQEGIESEFDKINRDFGISISILNQNDNFIEYNVPFLSMHDPMTQAYMMYMYGSGAKIIDIFASNLGFMSLIGVFAEHKIYVDGEEVELEYGIPNGEEGLKRINEFRRLLVYALDNGSLMRLGELGINRQNVSIVISLLAFGFKPDFIISLINLGPVKFMQAYIMKYGKSTFKSKIGYYNNGIPALFTDLSKYDIVIRNFNDLDEHENAEIIYALYNFLALMDDIQRKHLAYSLKHNVYKVNRERVWSHLTRGYIHSKGELETSVEYVSKFANLDTNILYNIYKNILPTSSKGFVQIVRMLVDLHGDYRADFFIEEAYPIIYTKLLSEIGMFQKYFDEYAYKNEIDFIVSFPLFVSKLPNNVANIFNFSGKNINRKIVVFNSHSDGDALVEYIIGELKHNKYSEEAINGIMVELFAGLYLFDLLTNKFISSWKRENFGHHLSPKMIKYVEILFGSNWMKLIKSKLDYYSDMEVENMVDFVVLNLFQNNWNIALNTNGKSQVLKDNGIQIIVNKSGKISLIPENPDFLPKYKYVWYANKLYKLVTSIHGLVEYIPVYNIVKRKKTSSVLVGELLTFYSSLTGRNYHFVEYNNYFKSNNLSHNPNIFYETEDRYVGEYIRSSIDMEFFIRLLHTIFMLPNDILYKLSSNFEAFNFYRNLLLCKDRFNVGTLKEAIELLIEDFEDYAARTYSPFDSSSSFEDIEVIEDKAESVPPSGAPLESFTEEDAPPTQDSVGEGNSGAPAPGWLLNSGIKVSKVQDITEDDLEAEIREEDDAKNVFGGGGFLGKFIPSKEQYISDEDLNDGASGGSNPDAKQSGSNKPNNSDFKRSKDELESIQEAINKLSDAIEFFPSEKRGEILKVVNEMIERIGDPNYIWDKSSRKFIKKC